MAIRMPFAALENIRDFMVFLQQGNINGFVSIHFLLKRYADE
jgi:hypothetical protein